MKTDHAAAKNGEQSADKKPLEIFKQGSVSIPIYRHTNIIPQRDDQGKIVYGEPDAAGKRKALVKYQSDSFMVAYYLGSQRVRTKCNTLEKARKVANLAAIKLSNGESEILKLTGPARGDYVYAMQNLRKWKPDAQLNLVVTDYVANVSRLPENVSLKEVVDSYLKRHPIGLPQKTVRQIVDELVEAKTKSGKSEIYTKELKRRLGKFADTFVAHRLSTISGKQIEDFIRSPKLVGQKKGQQVSRVLSGRTQNNVRQLINTLCKFAIKRGYLPKDHDEMSGVEKVSADSGDIEVFTPAELRQLFAACEATVTERGKQRTREDMIPYLAIAAFCGLRAAEIQRLDWAQVNLTGPERFVEVKAANAKTGSRRTVPIPDNCLAWLTRYAKPAGPVAKFERTDKQLFIYLAGKAGVPWKHNGLRHSFISYRVAETKNVHQTSLEAGNSPQMIFQHYRQLVTETAAKEWFSITPAPKSELTPMPAFGASLPAAGTPTEPATFASATA